MCGIAGFLYSDGEHAGAPGVLRKMCDTLCHRGPDADGYFTEGPIALGHRRLKIIDLHTGQQPMASHDGTLVVVFNGEIYNYVELRMELEKAGQRFYTKSDTEVILAGYRQWGTDCVRHFNGMWAFALWDRTQQQLFCSRDRVGEKPLFYALDRGNFAFASEMKALFAFGVPKQPRLELLDAYLCFTYIPAPDTFFKNVSKLRPGHCILIRAGNVTEWKYWDVHFAEEIDARSDEDRILDEFAATFEDAVQIRMRSDVPFGAFLSGGLDSASVVSVMSRNSTQPVRTCTIGFGSEDFDERPLARAVANRFLTDHVERLVTANDGEELLSQLAAHYDEPFGDSSALPTYIVSKIARERVTVALTGDGGDEVLCGYTIHQGERFAESYQRLPSLFRQWLVPTAVGVVSSVAPDYFRAHLRRSKEVVISSGLDFVDRLEAKQTGFTRAERRELLVDNQSVIPAREFIETALEPVKHRDNFTRLNYWLHKISLPDDMLCKVDRASMANSLETRTPFLDYRIIELLASVSMKVKLVGYRRKQILRRTVGHTLPTEVLRSRKRGFAVPLQTWFGNGMATSIEVHARELFRRGLIRQDNLVKMINQHRTGNRNAGSALWILAMAGQCL
jgi:asparagine synthase (glutamine-hydrolysing)